MFISKRNDQVIASTSHLSVTEFYGGPTLGLRSPTHHTVGGRGGGGVSIAVFLGCSNDIMTSDHSPLFSTFQIGGVKQHATSELISMILIAHQCYLRYKQIFRC